MFVFCSVDRRWCVGWVSKKWNLKGIVGGEEDGSELGFGHFESG